MQYRFLLKVEPFEGILTTLTFNSITKMDFSTRNRQFGAHLKAECHRLHITRNQVCVAAGISSRYYTAVRHG